jgi:magnesium-transporting ATPase (P-type)
VNFLEKIFGRVVQVFQFILVFLFILFEEIIWEGIAKPIYQKIESLKIVQKLEVKIQNANRYIVLVLFLLFLIVVELSGVLASIFFVQGLMIIGLLLYLARIPLAAFVFWFFKVAKEKLLSFNWFKWSYDKLMSGVDWLKSRTIYVKTMAYMVEIKNSIKEKFKAFKAKYFSHESSFMKELKAFYAYMKNFKKNMKKSKEDRKND